MKQPCARAAVGRGKVLLALAVALFTLLLGGFLFRLPGLATRLLGLFMVFVAVSVFFDALEKMRAPEVVVERGRILWGAEAIPLARLRAARLGWWRSPGNLWSWSPALELDLPAGRRLLPLDRTGWWEVWDRLRELRPDLGLPNWRHSQAVARLLRQRRVLLPPGVRFYGAEIWGRALLAFVISALVYLALNMLASCLPAGLPVTEVYTALLALLAVVIGKASLPEIREVPPPPPPCQAP